MSSASLWVQTQHLPSRGLGLSASEPVPLGSGPSFEASCLCCWANTADCYWCCRSCVPVHGLGRGLLTQHIWHQHSQLDSFVEFVILKIVFYLVTGAASDALDRPASRPAARNKAPQGCSWNKCSSFELWAGLVSPPCCILLSWSVQIATTQTK